VRDAVVFIGIAQEKAYAFSAHRLLGKRATFEFSRNKSVIPNYYYFYLDDADWGESFIKVCSYAPWGLKLYLNGHEWLKRQLMKEGIGFETLDNGFLSCQNPERLQALANALGPQQFQSFLQKWLDRLPMPLSTQDRGAGYDYRLSIWQMEFKHFDLKQYFKEGRGLRTEGTFHDPGDFGLNKGIENMAYLINLGRQINRRLLEVERVSQNCGLSAESIQQVVQPTVTQDSQRAPGLKFGDPRVMALMLSLCAFGCLIDGFRSRELRSQVAALLGVGLEQYSAGQMSYDLRRLLRKGIICRVAGSQRCYLTPYGWRLARFYARLEARVFRPALTAMNAPPIGSNAPLNKALRFGAPFPL
jgi:hypothetical protein